jgi:hypothetical protein
VSSGIFLPLPSILGIFGVSFLVPSHHGRLVVRGWRHDWHQCARHPVGPILRARP